MKPSLGYIGAFVAGVLCTMLVYEAVRVVTNTRQAFEAASAQMGEAVVEEPASESPGGPSL